MSHILLCSVWGFCAQHSGADEHSRLYMKPSVHRREQIESQTSGCYSSSGDAELNSLMMMMNGYNSSILREQRLIYCYEACWMCLLNDLLSVLNLLKNKYQNLKQVFGGFLS